MKKDKEVKTLQNGGKQESQVYAGIQSTRQTAHSFINIGEGCVSVCVCGGGGGGGGLLM